MALSYEEQLRRNGVTQEEIDRISNQFGVPTSSPTGQPPSSTQSQVDALQFGASGRGEFPENDPINQQVLENTNQNLPTSYTANSPFLYADPNSGSGYRSTPEPTLSADQAKNIASPYGFKSGEFAGLTMNQANAKIEQKKKAIGAQTSANTSYTFNPQTISGFNNKIKDLKLQLDSSNSSPWLNQSQKDQNKSGIVSSYTDQLASLFQTPEDFNVSMQNPDFQRSLQQYQALGGTPTDILAKIQSKATPTMDTQTGLPQEQGQPQTMTDYLASLTDPAQRQAVESLIPESKILQEQIAFQQSIPEEYKELYFGSPEQVGLLQRKQQEEQEKIKIYETQAQLDKDNAKAQAELLIAKNASEFAIENSKIEENRLNAKNYMTGMLAKLGALNTTGAAPQALATLEQKYQQQSQQLSSAYSLQNKEIENKLSTNIRQTDIDLRTQINKIKSDLSETEENIYTKIIDLQSKSQQKIFDLVGKFATTFRTQTEKYSKEAKTLAEKNLKEQQRILEKFDPATFAAQSGVRNAKGLGTTGGTTGTFTKTELNDLANARLSGTDNATKVFFIKTEPAFKQWFTRQMVSGNPPSTVSGAYEQWKIEKNKDSEGSGELQKLLEQRAAERAAAGK